MLLKKYANRKLYSFIKHDYVTLEGLTDSDIQNLHVIDHKTKNDVTPSILKSIYISRILNNEDFNVVVNTSKVITDRLSNYAPNAHMMSQFKKSYKLEPKVSEILPFSIQE